MDFDGKNERWYIVALTICCLAYIFRDAVASAIERQPHIVDDVIGIVASIALFALLTGSVYFIYRQN